ncbi:MAG: CAP domain-containing protein [bacterium]|nr:CAP domain-containing protein [bacterium]
MRDFLHHLFLPRESNNHRARILHHTSLLAVIVLLFVLEFSFSFLHEKRGDILGLRTDIAVTELLSLTNKKREENGLPPVQLDPVLSEAASQKAADMFAGNYWAHNSPNGTTPWVFIKSSGYDYLYAGENLARGFSTSSDVINAWMQSPGHRENMLSPNYKDIGFAVVPGTLTGDETMLVVEMFGKRREGASDIADARGNDLTQQVPQAEQVAISKQSPLVASFQTQPLVDVKDATKGISLVLLFVFFFTLLLDIMILKNKKIVRIVAHNIDTIMFISVVITTIILIGKGVII